MKKRKVVKKVQKPKKKTRLKYKNILIFFLLIITIGLLIKFYLNLKITNILVYDNLLFTDNEIIALTGLEEYPCVSKVSAKKIKKQLEENQYILSAKVKKQGLTKIIISVEENRPLIYSLSLNKTVLLDGSKINEKHNVPVLINYVPDTIYEKFINKLREVDINILNRISEVKYDPNNVDNERFFLTMSDGNYVYLTINRLESINSYVNIIKEFDNKKGILHLDYGGHFTILED